MARRMYAALAAPAVLTATLLVGLAVAPASGAGTEPNPSSLPIIGIHGFDSQDCPGSDSSYGWMGFDHVLRNAGWTGPLLPVSFYACDSNGADISGYGPDTPAIASPEVTPGRTRAGYYQDASIVTLAHDLAWYVYRNFTIRDEPVDMVSLSMGGLVARTALSRVRAGDPTFPPQLRVAQSITFSTPHHGLGTVASNGDDPGCHHMLQCEEWGADSPLMTELMRDGTDPQGTGGTRWTVIGSSAGCDFLPIASAEGLPHALQVDLTAPCYSHIGYFWDIEPEHTATAVVRDGDDGTATTVTDAPHSLTLATILLQNPPAAPAPSPTPTQTTPNPPTPAPTTPAPTTPAPIPKPKPTPKPVVAVKPIVTPLPKRTTSRTVPVHFRSGGGAARATFELRYRSARRAADYGSWSAPATLRGLPAGTRSLRPSNGTKRFCVSARARIGATVSAWTTPSCTAMTTRRHKKR